MSTIKEGNSGGRTYQSLTQVSQPAQGLFHRTLRQGTTCWLLWWRFDRDRRAPTGLVAFYVRADLRVRPAWADFAKVGPYRKWYRKVY